MKITLKTFYRGLLMPLVLLTASSCADTGDVIPRVDGGGGTNDSGYTPDNGSSVYQDAWTLTDIITEWGNPPDNANLDLGQYQDEGTPWDPGSYWDPGNGQDFGPQDTGTTATPVKFVPDQDYRVKFEALLAQAKTSIDLVELEFLTGQTPDQWAASLMTAAQRGVAVRIMLESEVEENAARVEQFSEAGLFARLDNAGKTLHSKLVIVDGRHVLMGSSNLSWSSVRYNHEANLYIDDVATANDFTEYVDDLFDDPTDFACVGTGSSVVSAFGDGKYRDFVEPLIDSAKNRVLVVLYNIQPDDSSKRDVYALLGSLDDAKGRGLDVRVLLEYSDFNDTLNDNNLTAANLLQSWGIPVRFDDPETTTHAKMVVTDGSVTVYSGNWLYTGLEQNHEVGAISNDPSVTTMAVAWFEGMWTTSEEQ